MKAFNSFVPRFEPGKCKEEETTETTSFRWIGKLKYCKVKLSRDWKYFFLEKKNNTGCWHCRQILREIGYQAGQHELLADNLIKVSRPTTESLQNKIVRNIVKKGLYLNR